MKKGIKIILIVTTLLLANCLKIKVKAETITDEFIGQQRFVDNTRYSGTIGSGTTTNLSIEFDTNIVGSNYRGAKYMVFPSSFMLFTNTEVADIDMTYLTVFAQVCSRQTSSCYVCSVNDYQLTCPFNENITYDHIDFRFTGIQNYSYYYIYLNGWVQMYSSLDVTNANKIENIESHITTIDDTLSQDHEYDNNASVDTTTQEGEMENYEQEEQNLRENLNLNIEDSEITINPHASSFIWEVINRLREMNGKIVLLFTSVLSLGIMKMILSR